MSAFRALIVVGLICLGTLDGAAAQAQGNATAPAEATGGAESTPTSAATSAAPEQTQAGANQGGDQAAASAMEAPTPEAQNLDSDVVDRVIHVLEDEAARTRVLDTLRTIHTVEGSEEDSASSLVTRPVELVRDAIDRRVEDVNESLAAVLSSGDRVEDLYAWLAREFASPSRRAFWAETLGQIGLVLGVGTALGLLVRRFLRRVRTRFEFYAPPTPLHFAGALVLHLVVRLIPIVLAVAAAASVALALGLSSYTLAVTRSLVTGFAFVTSVNAVVRVVLNVRNRHMHLFPLRIADGLRVQRGLIVITSVGGYGYFLLQAARALGLPWTLHAFFEHILFFVTFVLFVRFILRHRQAAADGLRTVGREASGGLLARFLPWALLARTWHWIAILLGLAIYLSWALKIVGGPAFLIRAVIATLAVAFVGRLINVWLSQRAYAGAPSRATEEAEDGELPELLVTTRHAAGTFLLQLVTAVVCATLILEAWGVHLIGWLASEEGAESRNRLVTIAIGFALAYGAWQALRLLIQNAIEETDRFGRQVRSSRTRTLLAIGRSFAFFVIWFSFTAVALSELGVNLAPLLAGAGVVGLAIGFGSQQLVQDIITGFFILIEDTISVGDVADLGGKVGVVESISLRTVRLRGYDGQVHTIPFSQIATISNLTKEFSYYVFDIGVAYKENVDHVMEVMADVGRELERERPFSRLVLAPLEIAGVNQFADSAVVIRARIKTRPLQQWTVGREYNRRLKNRFDELGIEIPFPQRTVHVMESPAAAGSAVGAAQAADAASA